MLETGLIDSVTLRPRGRILIVDDDRDFANGLSDIMELWNYQDETVNSAEKVLEKVKIFLPDVALIDIRLGNVNGTDLITPIKKLYPVVCIMVTGYATIETAIEAIKHGADDYLKKPLNPSELQTVLERCFKKIELEREKACLEKKLEETLKDLENRVKERTKELTESNEKLKQEISMRMQIESRLKDSMKEAQCANEAKSVFLSSVSHELRTPMNSILGFAQLLELDTVEPLSEKQRERIGHIVKSGNHLLKLINEVLDLSRIESGNIQLSMDSVQIFSIISEVYEIIEPMARMHDITINNRIKQSDQYILADRTRLRQVLMNLLSNAIKYNNPKGSVTISCKYAEDDTIRINIEDTGPGLTNNKLKSLFEPFNRLGMEALNIEGTGIGLTITKRLVELMGGSIGVESKVGKGTIFYIDLKKTKCPVAINNLMKDVTNKKDLAGTIEKKTLLYVEDNPINLKLVECILQYRPNIKLLIAGNAEEGIEMAQIHHPDIILMDIKLPGMDGYEATKLLKSNDQTKEIPVIALSANAMQTDIERSKIAGFKYYITKPINVNKFLETVDTVLNIAQ